MYIDVILYFVVTIFLILSILAACFFIMILCTDFYFMHKDKKDDNDE